MTLETGYQLQQGRYVIQSVLGQGGMGTVYLAADRNLPGRLVAIKENADASQSAQEQFQYEAVLLARLNHPNLPRVTDHFIEPSGLQYLVMDYVEGDDLREVQQQENSPLPEALVLGWIEQVMSALEHMHNWIDPATRRSSPIIHRDIKPGNIKRTPNGRIVLVDFGLAKYEANDEATVAGARAFTAGYSPIEQYTGGTNVRSDIYALGATLYTLLTNQRPPDAMTLAGGARLPPPRQLNPQISRTTERVILHAMQVQADARYQSITAMRDALLNRRTAASGRSNPITQQSEYTLSTYTKRSDRRVGNVFLWIGGILLLGLLAVGIALSAPLANQWRTLLGSRPPTVATASTPTVIAVPNTPAAIAVGITTTLTTTNPITATAERTASITDRPPTIIPITITLPSDTATPTVAPSPTATATKPPTVQPTATPPPSATATVVVTVTPSPTTTATATKSPTVQPTRTSRPTATATTLPSATATALATSTVTPSPTTTATATKSPTVQPTRTPQPTATATTLPSATATALATSTVTPSPTTTTPPKPSATVTQPAPPTATATRQPTATALATTPPTPTLRPSQTATPRPTATTTPAIKAPQTATSRPPVTATPLAATPIAAVRNASPIAGETRVNTRDQATYVFIPGGDFLMGSTLEADEQPPRTVTVAGFWISRTEITNAQYARCVEAGECTTPHNSDWNALDRADFPVTHLDWGQASTYAHWVGGHLPTEAQWEKAARGTDGRTFPWGEEGVDAQRLNFNSSQGPVAVGSYPAGASPYGVLDMAGNVEEWVADWYGPDVYQQAASDNPTGPDTGIFRVVRGGSFNSSLGGVRAAARDRALPTTYFDSVGFRVYIPEADLP